VKQSTFFATQITQNRIMADIYKFTPKTISNQSVEIDRLRAKLMELYETRDAIVKEIRYTKDAINLLEKGEK
jgi:hypothetical protein